MKDTLTGGVNFVLISANIKALPGRILLNKTNQIMYYSYYVL